MRLIVLFSILLASILFVPTFSMAQVSEWAPDNNLIAAARGGYIGTMRKELLRGANVNAFGRRGIPPLIAATEGGKPRAVEFLLEKGALPNLYDKNKRTALSIAARGGYVDIVEMLLGAGADGDRYHSSGDSPLRIAVRFGHAEIVRKLLDYDVDVWDTDITGRTALDLARESRNPTLVDLLENADN